MDVDGDPRVPDSLVLPGFLLIVGLSLDLLQYVISALLWGAYGRLKEKAGVNTDEEFIAPAAINWPALICYHSNILAVLAAYWLIGHHLGRLILQA